MIESLELRHLRYFVAVAEELHFGRAAERLALSQPPLTQQIQRLEQRLGCPLFERTTRRTSLTAAGETLLPLARQILEQAQRAIDATQRAGRGELGRLTIATPPSLMLGRLPGVIRAFRRRLPGVELELREASTAAIVEALERGAADLGFLRGPACPPPLVELARESEPLVALLPRAHRLQDKRTLRPADLAGEPFVFFPRRLGPAFYDEITTVCGFAPRVVQEATQWATIAALVEAGLGVTIAPWPVARLAGRGCLTRALKDARTTVILASTAPAPGTLARRFADAYRMPH